MVMRVIAVVLCIFGIMMLFYGFADLGRAAADSGGFISLSELEMLSIGFYSTTGAIWIGCGVLTLALSAILYTIATALHEWRAADRPPPQGVVRHSASWLPPGRRD